MKRVIFIVLAALLVLCVYPSAHPYAKSPVPGTFHGPSVITPQSDGDPLTYADSGDDDSDDGDSDDVAGWRDQGTRPGGLSPGGQLVGPIGVGLAYKMWWNFMVWIR